MEAVHHPTGVTYHREGLLASGRSLLNARDTRLAHEPLAALGEVLALCRRRTSFSALAEDDVAPFGSVERDDIVLIEADANGAQRRAEFFAADHLGDAVARTAPRPASPPRAPECRDANAARFDAALAAGDVDALAELFPDDDADRAPSDRPHV